MQNKNIEMKGWKIALRGTGFAILLFVLAFLAGCSAGKNIKPEDAMDISSMTEAPVVEEFPSVARLEDGRHGFVIREKPCIDGEWDDDFESALSKMKDQDYEGAIVLLEKVIDQSPGVTAPYINIAICYERIGKPDLAEQHLKSALELVPDQPVASNEYGLLLRKAGRFAEARAVYEKALASFPEYLPMHRNLGILCDLYLNDTDCALEQYEIYRPRTSR
jgi:tetratricopeptide (TPR) repeat protein